MDGKPDTWNKGTVRRPKSGKPLRGAPAKGPAASEANLLTTLAAIATTPTLAHARELLETEHEILTTPDWLRHIEWRHREEVEAMREKVAPKVEQAIKNKLLSNVWYAGEVQTLALERTDQLLKENKLMDPSTVGRNLADMQSKGIEKRRLMEEKPNTIVENRTPAEIIRALEGFGVLKQIDAESTATEG